MEENNKRKIIQVLLTLLLATQVKSIKHQKSLIHHQSQTLKVPNQFKEIIAKEINNQNRNKFWKFPVAFRAKLHQNLQKIYPKINQSKSSQKKEN